MQIHEINKLIIHKDGKVRKFNWSIQIKNKKLNKYRHSIKQRLKADSIYFDRETYDYDTSQR